MTAQVIYVDFAAKTRLCAARGEPVQPETTADPAPAAASPASAGVAAVFVSPVRVGLADPPPNPRGPASRLAEMPATASLGALIATLQQSSARAAAAFATMRAGSAELAVLSVAMSRDATKMAACMQTVADAIGALRAHIDAAHPGHDAASDRSA